MKYKYTQVNGGFCILCTDDFKILKLSNKLSKFSTLFTEKTSHAPTLTPKDHTMFLVDKIDMWPLYYIVIGRCNCIKCNISVNEFLAQFSNVASLDD